MDTLSNLLQLPQSEKQSRGLLYTPAEIAQQPATWQSTFELFRTRQNEIADFLSGAGVGNDAGERPIILLVGAGTSDYVGKCLVHLLRRIWQCEIVSIPSTDLLIHFDQQLLPGRRYLWISFSRSGDSPEGVAVLARALAKYPDVFHLVVCCNRDGEMLRQVQQSQKSLAITLSDEVNDRGLAMTSSFSNMVVLGHCLAHYADLESYEPVLEKLVTAGAALLGPAADTASLMASGGYSQACFVGSGPLRGVAQEAALKMLEMTAGTIHTMSESTLGLRHGPMAALHQDTVLVDFASADSDGSRYDMDLLREIGRKNLVRTRIAVAGGPEPQWDGVAEHHLRTAEGVQDDYLPPVSIIFGQLLGLFFSLRCNLQPDRPSPNGAISRVVEHVSVYS